MAHPTRSAITCRIIPFSTQTNTTECIQGIEQPLPLTEAEAQINKYAGSGPEMVCSQRAMMDDVSGIKDDQGKKLWWILCWLTKDQGACWVYNGEFLLTGSPLLQRNLTSAS